MSNMRADWVFLISGLLWMAGAIYMLWAGYLPMAALCMASMAANMVMVLVMEHVSDE